MTDLQQALATGAAPAGWYADPSGEAARRWWSGVAWTEHVEAAPITEYVEPAAMAPAPDPAAVFVEPDATAAPSDATVAPLEATAAPSVAPRAPTLSAALIGRDADDIAREQASWHSRRAPEVHRPQAGSISAAAPVERAAGYRHNWIAGVALFVAILSIPALGANVLGLLPPLTVSIFSGAPVGLAALAVVMAFRNGGRGVVLSFVALVLSSAVLAVGLVVDPAVLHGVVDTVMGWLPS